MDWRDVTSSNVAAVGYENGALHVRFTGGKAYHYHGVPEDLHQRLLDADAAEGQSVGKVFHGEIKPKYPHCTGCQE